MTAFGELRIIAEQDIGELGPKESKPVIYNWKWYYSAAGLGLWVLLILAFVLVKANRNRQALMVLVPLLAVNLLWLGFSKLVLSSFGSADQQRFSMVFHSLAVGLAILWLLCHLVGGGNRFVTFLLALVIMAAAGCAAAISYGMAEFSQQTMGVLIFLVLLVFSMLLGFVLSGWSCRKRYSGMRFVLWLAVWTVVASAVVMLVLGTIWVLIVLPEVSILWMFVRFVSTGLISGFCVYIIDLPYVLLALRSGFFRERLCACLRLKSMPARVGQADTIEPS